MEKVQELSGVKLPSDSFQVALLNLLQNLGLCNSLQDLATSIQAVDDGKDCVALNVNKLLCKLVETLAWADDYKLQDMAHRHEMKFVMNYGYGGCVHLQPKVTKHRCIQLSLQVTHSSSLEVVTAEQLNAEVHGLLQCHLPEESCERCNIRVNRTGSLTIQKGCDPDFLTVVCESPVSFSGTDFNITFSHSKYRVMTVVSWDTQSRQASVSRERPDGWWWQGVDEGQVPSYKYSAEQVQAFRHLKDVSVLMSVRVDAERGHVGSDSQACEELQSALSKQVVKGGPTIEVRGPELGSQSVKMDQADIEVFSPPLTSTQIGGEKGGKGSQGTCREAAGIGDVSLEVLDTCQGDGDPALIQDTGKEEETQGQRCVDNVCVCGFVGVLADHLRISKQCVDALRKEPLLKMKASEAVFIVKASLMLRGPIPMQCPAEGCSGGSHDQLPEACILWWRERGWKLMGWNGSSANADSEGVNHKIRQFCRNLRHRNKGKAESSSTGLESVSQEHCSQQSEAGRTNDGGGLHLCQFCPQEGLLVPHLYQEKDCLIAYLKRHLPNRVQMYRGKTNLAVFDLGIICKFCPNPACEGNLEREGVKHHVEGTCLQFFRIEGQQLFSWDQNLSASSIETKLKGRRSTLKEFLRDRREVTAYQQELAQMLKFTCSSCRIQGPLLDWQKHRIYGAGISSDGSRQVWKCFLCSSSDDAHQEMLSHAEDRVRELGSPDDHGDTLRKVVIEVEGNQGTRVVFVPASLIPDYEAVAIGDNLNPMTTTVLVPKNPEALEQIGDDALERANTRKRSLEGVAEFFGRRHFYGSLTETLTIFHLLKLGAIRVERLTMLSNQKRISKGKITSRNPNHAQVTGRKPHYAETLKFCLTNTCSWSTAASEKRSQESAARASINGQVKIKVEITLISNLARDSPLLRDIILSCPSTAPLICFAPTVLNYVKAKARLLLKHIIAPMYSNWDLELRFADSKWTVTLVGFLHCEEFEEVNKRIARGEVSWREIAKEIQRHPAILPTTAITATRLKEEQHISDERAQVTTSLFFRVASRFRCRQIIIFTLKSHKTYSFR